MVLCWWCVTVINQCGFRVATWMKGLSRNSQCSEALMHCCINCHSKHSHSSLTSGIPFVFSDFEVWLEWIKQENDWDGVSLLAIVFCGIWNKEHHCIYAYSPLKLQALIYRNFRTALVWEKLWYYDTSQFFQIHTGNCSQAIWLFTGKPVKFV